jgi:hypothetical protein
MVEILGKIPRSAQSHQEIRGINSEMTLNMKTTALLLKLAIVVAAIIAALQWIVVGERAWAAAWASYKYAGKGHISVTQGIQVCFFACSSILIASAYLLQRLSNLPHWRNLARVVFFSATSCTLFWVIILFSPIVKVVQN